MTPGAGGGGLFSLLAAAYLGIGSLHLLEAAVLFHRQREPAEGQRLLTWSAALAVYFVHTNRTDNELLVAMGLGSQLVVSSALVARLCCYARIPFSWSHSVVPFLLALLVSALLHLSRRGCAWVVAPAALASVYPLLACCFRLRGFRWRSVPARGYMRGCLVLAPYLLSLPLLVREPALAPYGLLLLLCLLIGLEMLWQHTMLHVAGEASRLKDEFVSNVSHEIRTPLLGARYLTDNLLEGLHGALSPAQAACVESIRKQHQDLNRLLADILDISKIEANHLTLKLEPVPVQEIVNECAGLIRPALENKRLHWQLDVPDRDVVVWADRARVKQILMNLLDNAVKHTTCGRIGVGCRQECGTAAIWVSDTGCGIARDEQARIFEEFHRKRGAGAGGFGLGLSIARKLVKLQGGQIRVESTLGQGSRFTFSLPLAAEQRASS